MEMWEGAILVVGGILLVGYMTRKNSAVAAAAGTTAPSVGAGVTNASNLTNGTNTAGGYPTVAGEPLTPPAPTTILGAPNKAAPRAGGGSGSPAKPLFGGLGTIASSGARVTGGNTFARPVGIATQFGPGRVERPVDVHL